MAKVEPLPGIQWTPAAALANLLEESDDIGEILIIYRDKDGIQYSQAGGMARKDVLWMIEFEKQRLLKGMV